VRGLLNRKEGDVASSWRFAQTEGQPAVVRDCDKIVAVLVDDEPTDDLISGLTPLGDRFAMTMYAESSRAAVLGRTLELISGSTDLGFWRTRREVRGRTRIATVCGDLVIADGRREPPLFGGLGRIHHDFRRSEEFDLAPPQEARLLELEEAGIDLVELPSNPPVDNRFAGLNFTQPVVISIQRLRGAEESGRLVVEW
jgi:hypothetical protein